MKNHNFGKYYQGKVPGVLCKYRTKGINLVRERSGKTFLREK